MRAGIARPSLGCESCSANPEPVNRAGPSATTTTANHDGKAMCALIDCKQSTLRQLQEWQRASTRSAVNPSLSISHHNLPFPEATEIAASLFLT